MITKRLKFLLLVTMLTGILAACGGSEQAAAPLEIVAPQATTAEFAGTTPLSESTATPAPVTAATATPTPAGELTAASLVDDYDDALTVKNQLLLGTLRLEESAAAVTTEQAPELLLLWRALAALSASGTAAPEEIAAVQQQLAETMTLDQIHAIAAMQLTNADLQAFYVEIGLTELKTPEPDVTPQSIRMKDLPQADREATRTANGEEPSGGGSGSGKSSVLTEMVITLLENR